MQDQKTTIEDVSNPFNLTIKSNIQMQIPRQFKEFTIERLIHESNMSAVFLAKTQNHEVAIKFIPLKILDRSSVYLIYYQLHFCMPSFESLHYPDQRFYAVVMPLAMCDMIDYLEKNVFLEENEVCYIMNQVFEYISYLHEKNICHGDLKIERILLMNRQVSYNFYNSKHFRINISGSIHAKFIDDQEQYTSGTVLYAAPELLELENGHLQFKRKARYSLKIDSWSLGVILYCLIFHYFPFSDDSSEDAAKLLQGDVEFPDEYSPSKDCIDLISKLLIPDPDKRISVQEALNHPWIRSVEPDDIII